MNPHFIQGRTAAAYMHGTPSLPIGCVNATVLSLARYTSGAGVEHSPKEAITRIKRTIQLVSKVRQGCPYFGLYGEGRELVDILTDQILICPGILC